MKNNLSIRSLRGLAIGAVAAALLTTGVLAQPSEKTNLADNTYMVRMENNMTLLQENMKYRAPVESDLIIPDELAQNMDKLANVAEQNLKYKAPAFAESEILISEMDGNIVHQPAKTKVSRKTTPSAQYLTVGYHPETTKHSKKNNYRSVRKNLAQIN